MRFGHYTVFDTPAENKHTQVYVEYDVPNNNNLDGATGTMVLSDAEEGNGILSITISPSITTTPALDSLFPIYYEDLTDDQKENGVSISLETTDTLNGTYSVSITPTAEWYAFAGGGIVSANAGEAITTSKLSIGNTLPISNIGVAASPDDDGEDQRYFNVSITITSGE